MNANRKKAENLIYDFMDILDNTGTNTAYYKNLFSKMSDTQFMNWCKRDLPIRFHTKPWVIEPTMGDIKKALDYLGVPLTEKIALPYLYTNKNGEPVWSKPGIVIYIHIKKMKQFVIKKSNIVSGIDDRDMKSGLLVSHDKGGKTSDREMEGLIAFNMNATMKELSTWRADYMNAKAIAYNTIANTGTISDKDIPIENEDSLAKNMLNYYMLGSCLYTNIINQDYMLPSTVKNRQRRVEREV